MNKIDFIDRNSGLEYNMHKIESFCNEVLSRIGAGDWEFSVLFCSDDYIAELNEEFRHKSGPTDILTFCEADSQWDFTPDGESWYAGDMIISVDSLKKNAEEFKVEESEELKRLLIHGILHLKGMDHATNAGDEEMLVMQENILKDFGDFEI